MKVVVPVHQKGEVVSPGEGEAYIIAREFHIVVHFELFMRLIWHAFEVSVSNGDDIVHVTTAESSE